MERDPPSPQDERDRQHQERDLPPPEAVGEVAMGNVIELHPGQKSEAVRNGSTEAAMPLDLRSSLRDDYIQQRYWAVIEVGLKSNHLAVHDSVLQSIRARFSGRNGSVTSSAGRLRCRLAAGDLLQEQPSVLQEFGASVAEFLGDAATGDVSVKMCDLDKMRRGESAISDI